MSCVDICLVTCMRTIFFQEMDARKIWSDGLLVFRTWHTSRCARTPRVNRPRERQRKYQSRQKETEETALQRSWRRWTGETPRTSLHRDWTWGTCQREEKWLGLSLWSIWTMWKISGGGSANSKRKGREVSNKGRNALWISNYFAVSWLFNLLLLGPDKVSGLLWQLLLFVMKVMVWYFVIDSHEVMTAFIISLPSNCSCGDCSAIL